MKNMLTIDPGMNTGLALWNGEDLLSVHQITVKHTHNVEDFCVLAKEFEHFLWDECTCLHKVVIEYPGLWAGSAVSMAAASSGDLVKLATMVGILLGVLRTVDHVGTPEILLPSPQGWKGQLPKEGVEMRVRRALGRSWSTTHMNDAVGIGLHILGKFTIQNSSIKAFANAPKPKMHSMPSRAAAKRKKS